MYKSLNSHEGAIGFDCNSLGRRKCKNWCLLGINVGVEQDLKKEGQGPELACGDAILRHTWLAAGLIFAEAKRISRSDTPKLLTPMLLRGVSDNPAI